MELNVNSVNKKGLLMKTNGNTVIITGSIDCEKPSKFMTPFFNKVHNEVVKKKIKKIRVDITKLVFLNSAGIKEFVTWGVKLFDLPEELKYEIKYICNFDVPWQEASIELLVSLNSDLLNFEITSPK